MVHPITQQTHRIWFENPFVGKPSKDAGGGKAERVFPRDCREGVSLLVSRRGAHSLGTGYTACGSCFHAHNINTKMHGGPQQAIQAQHL